MRADGIGRVVAVACVIASGACVPEDASKEGSDAETTTAAPGGEVDPIYVNEVMLQNTVTWQDEGGAFPDWVELWNPNNVAVDLSGWWMSDDADAPFDWQIPDGVVLQPDEHVVVVCDGDSAQGPLHASFHLASAGGEDVALFGPNLLGNPLVDAVEDLAAGLPDQSLARSPDGGPTWIEAATPTPGTANEP